MSVRHPCDNRYLVHVSSFEQSFELGVVEKEGLWITGSLSVPLCITARSEVSGVACQDEGGRARRAVSDGVYEGADI